MFGDICLGTSPWRPILGEYFREFTTSRNSTAPRRESFVRRTSNVPTEAFELDRECKGLVEDLGQGVELELSLVTDAVESVLIRRRCGAEAGSADEVLSS